MQARIAHSSGESPAETTNKMVLFGAVVLLHVCAWSFLLPRVVFCVCVVCMGQGLLVAPSDQPDASTADGLSNADHDVATDENGNATDGPLVPPVGAGVNLIDGSPSSSSSSSSSSVSSGDAIACEIEGADGDHPLDHLEDRPTIHLIAC